MLCVRVVERGKKKEKEKIKKLFFTLFLFFFLLNTKSAKRQKLQSNNHKEINQAHQNVREAIYCTKKSYIVTIKFNNVPNEYRASKSFVIEFIKTN